MNGFGHRLRSEGGWTFIEATLAVVIMAIMVLGLTIVLLAFRDHLDRSWAVRAMDQYGNDALEMLTHELRNAVDVTVRVDTRDTDRITVKWLDPWVQDLIHTNLWYADLTTGQIKKDHKPIYKLYPPVKLRRGESFKIGKFKLLSYGLDDSDARERGDALSRTKEFNDATYTIVLTLRYTRGAINIGDRNWSYQKTYKNRVYLRNKNLIFQKGILGT